MNFHTYQCRACKEETPVSACTLLHAEDTAVKHPRHAPSHTAPLVICDCCAAKSVVERAPHTILPCGCLGFESRVGIEQIRGTIFTPRNVTIKCPLCGIPRCSRCAELAIRSTIEPDDDKDVYLSTCAECFKIMVRGKVVTKPVSNWLEYLYAFLYSGPKSKKQLPDPPVPLEYLWCSRNFQARVKEYASYRLRVHQAGIPATPASAYAEPPTKKRKCS